MDGGDVILIINHVDKRLGETEDRIMNVIREGREVHTREHSEQQSYCVVRMTPLQDDLAARQRKESDHDARVAPLIDLARWATNHWYVTVAIMGALVFVISYLGSVLHG